jgi:predicted metal-dependent hydrolase
MITSVLQLDDVDIPVIIRRSPRARRISLKIDSHNHTAILVLPRHISESDGLRFASQQRQWIMAQLQDLPDLVPFTEGAIIPVRGEDCRIIHPGAGRGVVENTDGTLSVFGRPEHLARRLKDWLKREARNDINPLVIAKSATLKKKAGRISIRDQKTRWGSCSANGNLSFNWRLVLAPPFVLEYVVAHEVAHLAEHNHSKAFWRHVRELTEFERDGREWLQREGTTLHRYG